MQLSRFGSVSAMVGSALLFGGCAGTPASSPEPSAAPAVETKAQAVQTERQTPPALALPRVAPADFGAELQLNQHLQISRGLDRHEIDAVLAIDGKNVKLAAIGMGLRLITLDYDGATVSEQRHPLLPTAVSGERILRDLVLTYWPAAKVQAKLPDGWQLRDADQTRELSWNGQIVIRIRYHSEPRWAGTAHLQNLQHGYELIIASQYA